MISIKTIIDCSFHEEIKEGTLKSLGHSDITLIKVFLPDYEGIVEDLSLFLDSSEIDRAKRFYKKKDEDSFIICRGLLKIVLSRCIKSDISKIKIDYHNNKKPYLPSHPLLFFNVSHSKEYALIALSNSPIGVDIEHINENYDFINSLSYIFNTSEVSYIENAIDKKFAFYSLWTRKEAFVKALGKGIDNDFPKVPCMDGSHILDISFSETIKNWSIQGFLLTNNYMGAVAYEKKDDNHEAFLVYKMPNKIEDIMALSYINSEKIS